MSYFTNIAVQNVNKGFVYITDLTWSLIFMISIYISNMESKIKHISIINKSIFSPTLYILILIHAIK